MEELARQVASTLEAEVGTEDMIGVSYYDEDGVGHVFRSDWAEEKYSPDQVDTIVEELRFEALGHTVLEQHQEESLHATIRIYDELLDIAIPIVETEGVALALDVDGDFAIREVVDAVEETIRQSGSDPSD